MRPLYRIFEAREYFYEIVKLHLRNRINLQQYDTDVSLCLLKVGTELVAVEVAYVDGVLITSDHSDFSTFKRLAMLGFDVKFDDTHKRQYLGLYIDSKNLSFRLVSQPKQIECLRLLPRDASFADFRQKREQLA